MKNGYFIIPRSVTSDPRYQGARLKYKHVLWKLFENAAFAPTTHAVATNLIEIQVGQFCVTLRHFVKICNESVKHKEDKIDKNTVERAIAFFEKCQFVRQEVRHRKTIITITVPEFYDKNKNTSETTSETRVRQDRDNKETVKEVKEQKVTVCKRASAPQKKGLNMQQNYIPDIFEKSDAQGNSVTVEIKTIMLMAMQEKKDWSTNEIQEAWKILYDYEGPVGNCFKFIEGTIKNFRREKTAENRLKHSKKENKSCKVTIEEIQSRKSLTECKQSNWEELLKEQDSQEQLCLKEFQKK